MDMPTHVEEKTERLYIAENIINYSEQVSSNKTVRLDRCELEEIIEGVSGDYGWSYINGSRRFLGGIETDNELYMFYLITNPKIIKIQTDKMENPQLTEDYQTIFSAVKEEIDSKLSIKCSPYQRAQ